MKLVKEHIEFERGKDPLQTMGIGLYPKIKEWCLNNNVFRYPDNDDVSDQIRGTHIRPENLFKYVDIKNLRINADCWVDISSSFTCNVPSHIKFGVITDNFACQFSTQNDYWKKPFPTQINGDLSFYITEGASRLVTESEIREVCKVGGRIQIKIAAKW
jgi:hypothetical protein